MRQPQVDQSPAAWFVGVFNLGWSSLSAYHVVMPDTRSFFGSNKSFQHMLVFSKEEPRYIPVDKYYRRNKLKHIMWFFCPRAVRRACQHMLLRGRNRRPSSRRVVHAHCSITDPPRHSSMGHLPLHPTVTDLVHNLATMAVACEVLILRSVVVLL